ncbi:MAG: hypothetical protein HY393_02130, partial [Candidatus Diapherotrites archaeon]|nr:hypothetical protein [Candidatus Diapherotrites archaeon]
MRVHSVFFFGGLLVFLFLAVLNTPWWGALATLPDSSEAWISSYDRMVTGFQPACATIEFRSFGGKNERVEMQTRVNAVPYSHDLLFLVQGRGVKSVCIEPSFLDFNDNVVSVMAGPHSLFFHVRKFESLKQDVVPRITLHGLEEDRVLVGVENLSLYGVQPLSIYVNGVKDHDLWPPQQGLLKERVESFEGSGVVQAEWGALTAGQQVAYEPVPRVPPLIGMVTLVLAGLACLAWFYSKPFWERVALGALSWVSGLIVLVFVLNYAWLLSPFTLNLSLLLIAGTILLHRRNVLDEAFHVPLDSFHVSMPFIFVGFLLVFCVFGVHWFASTPWTHFNVFYERASQGVIDALRIPSVDALSYLGRNATFIQGYFLFEAGISWLTGLEGVPLFAFVLAWANLLFVGAAYFLFKSAGFEGRFSWLGVVLVWLSAFVFDAAIVTPRHLIAFSLFMGSVGVFIRGSNAWKAGVLLAVASYVQVPVLAAFPFVVLALDKRLRVIETVQAAFIGLVGFLALFLPNAMAFGIPYEIRPHEWGYLITLPVASALYDHGALLLVFVG